MGNENKTEIAICLGSACFARGNNTTRRVIEDYIRLHGLWDKVVFHGARCFNHCQNGPVLKINELIYEHVDENNVTELLDQFFNRP
ncbi:MAG TPA: (2Fe-2S) ferredoxin domain-containing protein [Bacteroidales bacterium]|nr:(2Fe-2S) ferredoxin domain-containing protein [Bacteroidales bacterium]HSA42492.1 (2Fe-2S) ferredoxin domain-containing protein [Bacteroidales bacterium]